VKLPHKIATLLYCFNERNEVLLMERLREPNLGLWSPPGGKLIAELGESPYACACREAAEELALAVTPSELHLLGIVSEAGYEGQAHWLMFFFEVENRLKAVPPPHAEGRFSFFQREAIEHLRIPRTDRERIWPLVWKHRGGFFAAHCRSSADGHDEWLVEESRPLGD
jgi:8-oxo-dGTP diphosphatase